MQSPAPTPPAPSPATDAGVPLCVDLDGTLMRSDLLWESFLRLLRRNPLWLPAVFLWWLRGRACLKAQLAARVTVNPARLPYQEDFLEYLRGQTRQGRRLILATASDAAPAQAVARHVGLFAETLASDGRRNLRGACKAQTLAGRFGERGFDYAGNSSVDLAVWARARQAIVVNGSPRLARRAAKVATVGAVFGENSPRLRLLARVCRPWACLANVVVFAPLILTAGPPSPTAASLALRAFWSMAFCTGAVAVLGALLDADADRVSPPRRENPLATGRLPLSWGLAAVPLLALAALLVALVLPAVFLAAPMLFGLTALFRVAVARRFAIPDALSRASLNLARLLAGHLAIGQAAPPGWILAWTAIFLGLAIAQRGLRQTAPPNP